MGFALLSGATCGFAQEFSSSAQTETSVANLKAKSIIGTALRPIGDEQAIRTLDNCLVKGTVKQGQATGTFTWKNSAQEYWAESDVDSVHLAAASNHGKPVRLMNGKVKELSRSNIVTSAPLYHVGLSLLHSRDDATLAIAASSPVTARGLADVQITQAKPKDEWIDAAKDTWAFDVQTGLPSSHVIEPFVYHGRPLAATAKYTFSDYRAVSDVNVPHHIEQYLNDQLIRSFDIESIQCGMSLSAPDFELSGEAK